MPCRAQQAPVRWPEPLNLMATPQQILQAFLQEQASVFAEANSRLAPIHAKYFGEPLLQQSRDALLNRSRGYADRDKVGTVFEDVKQSAGSAIAITREIFGNTVIRLRFHLSAVGETWKIVRRDQECFLCHGLGRSGAQGCQRCSGEGWYDSMQV